MQRSHISPNRLLRIGFLLASTLVRCGGDDHTNAAQCEDWSNQASLGRRAAQDDAGRDCGADTDCELVDYELRCFADCGYPSAVASASVPELESAIDALDKKTCNRFAAAACPAPISPPCVPPGGTPSAVCRSGQCTLLITPY
jgi:hypothetical protein